MGITLSFDLEDHRASSVQAARFVLMTERFLAFLEERQVRATFFVVGELAADYPELVSRIAEAEHEVALHGWRHVPFEEIEPRTLTEELRRGRLLLEDLTGQPVLGMRAPIFSLTPATYASADAIAEAGFSYSSSVLPSRNPLHGWPGAPQAPFRWPNGLIELPCPVSGVGRLRLPFLGGVYFRYLPLPLILAAARRLSPDIQAWSYLHPYDLDPDEPFFRLPWAGWLTSRIVHHRRGATLYRIDSLIEAAGGAGPPLRELAAAASAAPFFAAR